MMQQFRIDFSGRSLHYTEEEIQKVVEVMRNADPLTQGQHQDIFEESFSRYNGNSNCFAISNCTAALEIAAMLCKLKPGDEIIIPAHTFCATAIPFARTGATIKWADINPKTFEISLESILDLVNPNTKAIVAVHLYGLMAPMQEIMDIAQTRDIVVIEDCAQAIGASLNGVKSGNFGDFACFSFHTHKNITTLGEGGMLTVRDDELATLVPGLRHNGIRGFGEREKYWIPAMSNVDFDINLVWPYNFCMSEPQCALGTELLKRIDSLNEKRNLRAQKIRSALRNYPELSFQHIPSGYYSAYHLLPARYDGTGNEKNSDDFIYRMAYTHGIKLVVQYYPLYRYPMFQKAGFGKANVPHTDEFFDNMVSFPFHSWMSDEDFDYMIDSTVETLEYLRRN